MAYPVPGHQSHDVRNRLAAGAGDDRPGHQLLDTFLARGHALMGQTADDIALREDADHPGTLHHDQCTDVIQVETLGGGSDRRLLADGRYAHALALENGFYGHGFTLLAGGWQSHCSLRYETAALPLPECVFPVALWVVATTPFLLPQRFGNRTWR